jgi:cytochrome P450
MPRGFDDYRAPGLLGNLGALRADPLSLLGDAHAAVGDFVRLPLLGPLGVYSVRHPDAIRHVLATQQRNYRRGVASSWLRSVLGPGLLTTDGEEHRMRQSALAPEWTKAAVHAMFERVVECTSSAVERWDPRIGQTLDIEREMNRLALDIIGHFLFGVDFEREAPWVRDALVWGVATMTALRGSPSMFLPRFVPTPLNRRLAKLDAKVQPALDRLLDGRRREDWRSRRDLLSSLLKRQEQSRESGSGCYAGDADIRSELVNFTAAGHETTATLLTWTFYYLAAHPEVEARLVAELRDVLGDRQLSLQDVPRLKYLGYVLSEVLRLRTPAWVIFRQSIHADEIAGRQLPERSVMLVSPSLVQRDERWFSQPELFDPLRFAEPKPSWPRFAYIPFGAGPHVCIGSHLAELESRVVLSTLLRRFRLRLKPGHRVRAVTRITVVPEGGLPMRIEARTQDGEKAPQNARGPAAPAS